ncbi:MAG: VCBS repeat-containing protein [Caldilineaceae bacterium]
MRLAVSAGVQSQPGGPAVPEQIQFTAAATAPQACTAAFTAIDRIFRLWMPARSPGAITTRTATWIFCCPVQREATRTTQIYRNESGSFVNTGISLPGFEGGSADWGDYDNDGDLDILLSGARCGE